MATPQGIIETLGAVTIALLSLALAIPSISAAAPPPLIWIRNYTVGGAAGWFFNTSTNTTAANYSDWAASQIFYVHDMITFNTRTTYCSIVQTSNETKYSLCDVGIDEDSMDTIIWSNDLSKNISDFDIILTDEGPNYFFSYLMNGEQCKMGMKFGINVLPENNQPPLPPSAHATPPPPGKNGVEGMQEGMILVGLGIFSWVLMAV